MIIQMPPLLDHLDEIIMRSAHTGSAVMSITLPVWCQQVFVNEVVSRVTFLGKEQFDDLDNWGICEYRGVQILFHDHLFSEIRMKPH